MYPFPLAANSSQHSDYHRFALGADPAALAPLPRPRCLGQLAGLMPQLTEDLTLPRWRKLYRASFPWEPGFGPDHYAVGALAPYRPVPAEYARPRRLFAAFDFVQIADPSVSALGLVGADPRAAAAFLALNGRFCRDLERGVAAAGDGPPEARTTGRCLLGAFAEPGNRWLMPLLHVHARVLNFTSFADEPRRLLCLDAAALEQAGRRARGGWVADQAEALARLGYRAALDPGLRPGHPAAPTARLRVDGVNERLLAALDAPRVAVLRVLERLLGSEGVQSPNPDWAQVAALADRLEQAIALAQRAHRPSKVALPVGGPWIHALRTALRQDCPADLRALDGAIARALGAGAATDRQELLRPGLPAAPSREPPLLQHAIFLPPGPPNCDFPVALFPAGTGDAAHRHAPDPDVLNRPGQEPCEPDFGPAAGPSPARSLAFPGVLERLGADFAESLAEVRAEIRRGDFERSLAPYRSALRAVDGLDRGSPAAGLQEAVLRFDGALEQAYGRSVGRPIDRAAERAPERSVEWAAEPISRNRDGLRHAGLEPGRGAGLVPPAQKAARQPAPEPRPRPVRKAATRAL